MALAIDASTPALVTGADPWTSASFTPPNGSLLVVKAAGDWFGGTPVITVTSTGLTFQQVARFGANNQGLAEIWIAKVGSNGGTARTVTVDTSIAANTGGAKVEVWTGFRDSVPVDGVFGGTGVTTNNFTANLTTGHNGCWVTGVGAEWNNIGACTSSDTNEHGEPGGLAVLVNRKATATATAGAETLNFDAASTDAAMWSWAAISIAPDTAPDPAIYKVADVGSGQNLTTSTSTAIDLPSAGSIATGDYLVARVALDNAGTNGAAPSLTVTDPRSNTWTVVGPGNVDPGAANAGSTCYIAYAKVVNAYTNGDDLTFNHSPTTPAKAIVVEEWHGVDSASPVAVASTTATGTSGAPSIARTPLVAGQLFYAALSVEGPTGDTFTQDTDTTDGAWQTLTRLSTTSGTAASNQTINGVAKLVTGATAQTWNPTITSRDWAAVALVFEKQDLGTVTGNGDAVAPAAVVSGVGNIGDPPITGTGSAVAPAATVSGAGEVVPIPTLFITGIAGSGNQQYPVDQNSDPILVKGDVIWAFPANAGRWNGNDWQGDVTGYLDARQAQGFNLLMIGALGSTQNGGPADTGATHDGILPFSGGNGVLNDTYWARVDYIVDQAALRGITVLMNVAYSYDMDTASLSGFSNANYTTYGTNLGNRYKTRSNLIWGAGGDYFDTQATQLGNLFTAVQATGDTHLISIQNYPETTSRKDISNNATNNTGTTWSDWNFVYSYNVTYDGVEYGYDETTPICVIWGDGHFEQDSTPDRKVMRDLIWWAFTSGARGHIYGSEGTWAWGSGAAANLTDTVPNTDLGNYWDTFTSFTNWHQLVPDTNSSFVTAGRGTHAAALASGGGGGEYNSSDPQDQYVTASITPDGTLAVVYFPVDQTITVDDTELGAGYTATWVDPTNGATSSATIASTYSPTGTNALGGADWLLVFESTASDVTGSGSVVAPAATVAGTGAVTVSGTGALSAPSATATGAGTVVVTGTGAVSAPAATASGSGEVFVTGTGTSVASPAVAAGTGGVVVEGSGSVTAPSAVVDGVGSIGAAPVTGSGTAVAPEAQASGTGSVVVSGSGVTSAPSALAAGSGTVTVAGTGSVSAAAAVASGAGGVVVAGSGTAVAPPAVAAGVGSIGAAPITGEGSLSAAPAAVTGAGSVVVAGMGSVAATPAQAAGTGAAIVSGAGGLSAAPSTVTGTGGVQVTGNGSATAPAAMAAGAGNLGDPVITGNGSAVAPAATTSGTGTTPISGTGTPTAPPATVSGNGTVVVDGDGSIVTPNAIINGTGAIVINGTGAVTAAAARVTGSGYVLAARTPRLVGDPPTTTRTDTGRTPRL